MGRSAVLSLIVVACAGCRDAAAPDQLSVIPALAVGASTAWTGIAAMSEARYAHAAAADAGGRIYVFSGFRTSALTTAEVFDPAGGGWSSITSPGAQVLAGAARGRDGRIYLVGGANASLQAVRLVQAYDPAADSWTQVADLGAARHTLAVTAGGDGRIYAIGGNAGGSALLKVVEVYDPTADAWTSLAPMAIARQGHAAATGPDGRIYVIGGFTSTGATAASEVYDPASNLWSPIADLPHYRYGLAAATGADGLVYVFGGFADGTRLSTVQAYDPAADSWTDVPSMSVGRYLPASAADPNGLLYVTGGNTPQGVTATAETFQTVSPNRAPIADAGADLAAECVGGAAEVTLDASGSSDPDGDSLTYEWLEGGSVIARGATAAVRFALGAHTIVLRVTDDDAAADEDDVEVTVADTRVPSITFTQYWSLLRPANHQLRLVALISARDGCDDAPVLDVTVSSNEPEDGTGDGNTSPDWQITPTQDGVQVWVRAERSGSGNGRRYTITATATDHAGNRAIESGVVTVGAPALAKRPQR
ncbi:MAG: hypothetical protein HY560_00595 [Gemmatimonadetes bacterium]|nr:hypothetical protein [Gemmatimonadota bacterium]